MIARLLGGALVLALTLSSIGCGCCQKLTRSTAPPCCPPGGSVAPPPPPPSTAGFPPTGHPTTYRP